MTVLPPHQTPAPPHLSELQHFPLPGDLLAELGQSVVGINEGSMKTPSKADWSFPTFPSFTWTVVHDHHHSLDQTVGSLGLQVKLVYLLQYLNEAEEVARHVLAALTADVLVTGSFL